MISYLMLIASLIANSVTTVGVPSHIPSNHWLHKFEPTNKHPWNPDPAVVKATPADRIPPWQPHTFPNRISMRHHMVYGLGRIKRKHVKDFAPLHEVVNDAKEQIANWIPLESDLPSIISHKQRFGSNHHPIIAEFYHKGISRFNDALNSVDRAKLLIRDAVKNANNDPKDAKYKAAHNYMAVLADKVSAFVVHRGLLLHFLHTKDPVEFKKWDTSVKKRSHEIDEMKKKALVDEKNQHHNRKTNDATDNYEVKETDNEETPKSLKKSKKRRRKDAKDETDTAESLRESKKRRRKDAKDETDTRVTATDKEEIPATEQQEIQNSIKENQTSLERSVKRRGVDTNGVPLPDLAPPVVTKIRRPVLDPPKVLKIKYERVPKEIAVSLGKRDTATDQQEVQNSIKENQKSLKRYMKRRKVDTNNLPDLPPPKVVVTKIRRAPKEIAVSLGKRDTATEQQEIQNSIKEADINGVPWPVLAPPIVRMTKINLPDLPPPKVVVTKINRPVLDPPKVTMKRKEVERKRREVERNYVDEESRQMYDQSGLKKAWDYEKNDILDDGEDLPAFSVKNTTTFWRLRKMFPAIDDRRIRLALHKNNYDMSNTIELLERLTKVVPREGIDRVVLGPGSPVIHPTRA